MIVLVDSSLEEQKTIGDYTHKNGKSLIIADTRGLCGQIFCDFGNDFVVTDTNGEQPLSVMLSGITVNVSCFIYIWLILSKFFYGLYQDKGEGIVACLDDNRHGFESGDYIKFIEVQVRSIWW